MGGFFYNLSRGHKARERRREETRRSESADHAIKAAQDEAVRSLSIAEEALANGDSRTAKQNLGDAPEQT